MSAYGSSAYGSLPIAVTTSVDFDSVSTLDLRSEGKFVLVQGPLKFMRVVTFGDKVLTRVDRHRDLYAGEIFVYEEHYFSAVDENVKAPTVPTTYVAGITTVSTDLVLGTQPATGTVRSTIEAVSGAATMNLGTESATAGFTGLLDNNAGGVWVDNNSGGTLVDANA